MDGVFFCGSGQGYMLSGLDGVSAIFAGRGFAFCQRVGWMPDFKENPSRACGRGGGARAFASRTTHAKLDKQVFSPSSVAARHLPGTHEKMQAFFSWEPRLPQAGGGIVCGFLKDFFSVRWVDTYD